MSDQEYIPLSFDEVRQALLFIPSDYRDTWINIGNACKTEFGDAGWQLWDEWSQQSDKYNAHDARTVWKSLVAGKVGIRYLDKAARREGWRRERRELTAEERRRLKVEAEHRRRKAAEAVERDQAKLARMQAVVAEACERVVERHLVDQGKAAYLGNKGVGGHGVLYPRRSVLISIDTMRERADVWAGAEVRDWFKELPRPRPDHLHMFRLSPGDVIVPMRDSGGKLWALQSINAKGGKMFPKFGRKMGNFHLIDPHGEPAPSVVAIAEGYATSASVHEAMGWPVAVALDAGNMARVLPLLKAMFPDSRLVICGDDDPDDPDNPGRSKAEELALKANCLAVFPDLGEVA